MFHSMGKYLDETMTAVLRYSKWQIVLFKLLFTMTAIELRWFCLIQTLLLQTPET